MPPEVCVHLMGERAAAEPSGQGPDIHEADLLHMEATSAAYRQMAAEGTGPWSVIACADGGAARSPSAIAEDVWAAVRSVL